jgi:hypothetical protein
MQVKMRFAQLDQLVGDARLMQDTPQLSETDSTLRLCCPRLRLN